MDVLTYENFRNLERQRRYHHAIADANTDRFALPYRILSGLQFKRTLRKAANDEHKQGEAA